MNDQKDTVRLRAGELAKRAGVSTDTLRHYERLGLLEPDRLPNGYRDYPPDSVTRVRLIQNALNVGFSLEELARVLRLCEKGVAPCREVREIVALKLNSLEDRIQGLISLKRGLDALLEAWDATLARTEKGKQARLLDMLSVYMPAVNSANKTTLKGSGKAS